MFDGLLKEAKLRLENDPEFAAKYYSRAIKRAARKYGPDATQTLNLRQVYAVALSRNGENEKAQAELAAVIARRELTADTSDGALQHAKEWHAHVLYGLGRFDEAEPEWRELSAECDRLLGANHPDAIEAHENHALTLARLGQVAEAEAEMADVVEKRMAGSESDDDATMRARTSRAVYLDTLGRREESEVAWRELAESKARLLGTSHPDAILALSRHAHVLYQQRRLQEAAAEFREVTALRAAALGADHPDTKRAQDWIAVIERELEAPPQHDEI